MKIRNKFLLVILIMFVIISISSSILTYYIGRNELLKSASNKLLGEVDATLLKTDLYMLEKYKDILELSENPVLRNKNSSPEEITSELLRYKLRNKDYLSISFFDTNRTRIADTEGYNLGKQHRIVGYWNDVLKGKVSSGNDIRVSKAAGNKSVIFFASPVRDDEGHVIRFVNTKFYVKALSNLFGNIDQETTHLHLLTNNGLVVYSNAEVFQGDKFYYYDESSKSYLKAKQKKRGVIIEKLAYHYNQEFMSAFSYEKGFRFFKGNNWIVIYSKELKYILTPINELGKNLLITNSIIFISAAVIIVFFIKKLISPIEYLSKIMHNISKTNDLNTKIKISSKDEIGDLGEHLQEMIERLRKSTISVEELENKVKERTMELNQKVEELEKFNKLAVGRELKMIELKKRIKELEEKLSK